MRDEAMEALIAAALNRFGLDRTGPATPIHDSVLNDNFRVETSDGVRFLHVGKAGRPAVRFRLEQAASAYASAQGVPAVAALVGVDGEALQEVSGRLVSLYPWVEGWTLTRDAIGEEGAHVLGTCLGLIHARFEDFRHEALPPSRREYDWDTGAAIAAIDRVRAALDACGEVRFREDLELKRELLRSVSRHPATFAGLRRQPSHGDFHERNVMFAPGTFEVVAVVDWERVAVFPLAFELWRALSFCDLFASPLS